jgi:hypothetical protein
MNTTNFTATSEFFLEHSHIRYWQFEVTYSFILETSTSALNFFINQPPKNGNCSISPLNGTTNTIFTIECLDWSDEDEDTIQDYSFYGKYF